MRASSSARDEDRFGGRLAIACHEVSTANLPRLSGTDAAEIRRGREAVVPSVHKNPLSKHTWVTELLGAGDIDRAIIEGGVCSGGYMRRNWTGRGGARFALAKTIPNDGQVADAHGVAAFGISPDPARGSSVDPAAALTARYAIVWLGRQVRFSRALQSLPRVRV